MFFCAVSPPSFKYSSLPLPHSALSWILVWASNRCNVLPLYVSVSVSRVPPCYMVTHTLTHTHTPAYKPYIWQYSVRGSIFNFNFPKIAVNEIALHFWCFRISLKIQSSCFLHGSCTPKIPRFVQNCVFQGPCRTRQNGKKFQKLKSYWVAQNEIDLDFFWISRQPNIQFWNRLFLLKTETHTDILKTIPFLCG